MDWSLTIAIIALGVSVFSPVLVTLLNNRHQFRMSKAEFLERHRAEVIEGYIRTAGQLIRKQKADEDCEFSGFMGEIYLHLEEEYWPDIDQITCAIIEFELDAFDRQKASMLLASLCKKLSVTGVRSGRGFRRIGRGVKRQVK